MTPANRKNTKTQPALGFLTVLEHEADGLYGGYLTLNLSGRPLEFHCTTPIKANRAQEILYGPTLQPYLYGEQIGQTLLEKATVAPLVVCTDRTAALAVREFIEIPVVLVCAPEEVSDAVASAIPSAATEKHWRLDAAHGRDVPLSHFLLGANRLAVPERSIEDRQAIVDRLGDLAAAFDLAEPFQRIRDAIEEARGGGR